MSWDATLIVTVDGHDLTVGEWNYTHNTNRMAAAALASIDIPTKDDWLVGPSWFNYLNGMSAEGGARFLASLCESLAADPDRYRAMNPENGWGNFDSFLLTLANMRDAALEWPSARWTVTG